MQLFLCHLIVRGFKDYASAIVLKWREYDLSPIFEGIPCGFPKVTVNCNVLVNAEGADTLGPISIQKLDSNPISGLSYLRFNGLRQLFLFRVY